MSAFFAFPSPLPTEPGMVARRVLDPVTPHEQHLVRTGETVWRIFVWQDGRKWLGTFTGPAALPLADYLRLIESNPGLWVELIRCC